jgi:class 3 adenylate cyclase/tetratricopeptide (TPR) repeat protein
LTGHAGIEGSLALVATITFLFVDQVDSTRQLARHGERVVAPTRDALFRCLRSAVHDHGGEVVDHTGDGIMAAFSGAGDAVRAAVAMHQGALRLEDVQLRVGLHTGEPMVDGDGRWFGMPIVMAARLCAGAAAGQILTSGIVEMLAGGDVPIVPAGERELKGLDGPVPVFRVEWEPAADAGGPQHGVPLPGLLAAGTGSTYVGRRRLIERLDEAWAEASTGSPRTVLLTGEPGAGKTRTAGELAVRAHAAGAVVLYGHCAEGLAAPYDLFVEALEWYARHATAPVLGRLRGELVRLVPELGDLVGELPPPVTSDPKTERFRLFEAVASWLLELSAYQPLLLVLDDLHWASEPTLMLLQHVVGAATGSPGRILLVVLYRDTEVHRSHPLPAAIGNLRRLPGVARLPVEGLDRDEVRALVASEAGHDLDDPGQRLADAIHAETEGNPFFATEVLRHLAETGQVRREAGRWTVSDPNRVAVPEGVRDVIGRRLAQAPDAVVSLLTTAAVVGREVDLPLLLALVDLQEEQVLDALDEALHARLLEETAPDRFRFSHALCRTALSEALSATRRRRLHRRVVEALEELHPEDAVGLAYHSLEADLAGADADRAARHLVAAGEATLALRAASAAEIYFRKALELLGGAGDDDLAVLALCGLGEAQRDQSIPHYRETLLEAGRRALRRGATELLVRAVLANHRGHVSVAGAIDEERLALAEAALGAVTEAPTPDRIRLLAQLASELTYSRDDERRLALADEAEALARAHGDSDLLGWVLTRTAFAAVASDRIPRLVARTAEAAELARRSGDPTMQVTAGLFHHGALLAAGRVQEGRHVLEQVMEAAADGPPTLRWMADATSIKLLAAAGRFAEAEAATEELLRVGRELGEPDADMWWTGVAFQVQYLKGTAPGLADAFGAFADEYPHFVVWRTGQVAVLADAGRLGEARALLAEHDFDVEALVKDCYPHLSETFLATTSYFVGDRDLARRTRAALAPHPDEWAQFNTGIIGPLSFPLGMAAAALGDWDEADRLLEKAVRVSDDLGLRGLANLMRSYQGRLLVDPDRSVDEERVRAVATTLASEAHALGTPALVDQAGALLHAVGARDQDPSGSLS